MALLAPALDLHRVVTAEEAHQARLLVHEVNRRDLGYGYVPSWHRDLDLVYDTYVTAPRHALFVATADGQVVATAGLRLGGPTAPEEMRRRYPDQERVGQIVRVARAQLDEGVLLVADYVDHLTDLASARLTAARHRIERVQAQARLLSTLGLFPDLDLSAVR